MRVLLYKVKGQKLMAVGNHSGLTAGTRGYLKAQFEFDDDWDGCVKAVSFLNDGEHAALLDHNNSCHIPDEALTNSTFQVKVEGRRKDGYCILTDPILERQKGGGG
jgi:hypothetical protein